MGGQILLPHHDEGVPVDPLAGVAGQRTVGPYPWIEKALPLEAVVARQSSPRPSSPQRRPHSGATSATWSSPGGRRKSPEAWRNTPWNSRRVPGRPRNAPQRWRSGPATLRNAPCPGAIREGGGAFREARGAIRRGFGAVRSHGGVIRGDPGSLRGGEEAVRRRPEAYRGILETKRRTPQGTTAGDPGRTLPVEPLGLYRP